MATIYFDSSALVKLLLIEEGAADVASLLYESEAATGSRLLQPEVLAALAAARRNGRITEAGHRVALGRWVSLWDTVRPIELSEAVAEHAGRLAEQYALRGADAVHLASALTLGTDGVVFAAWDRRLRDGAAAAGLELSPAAV